MEVGTDEGAVSTFCWFFFHKSFIMYRVFMLLDDLGLTLIG